MSTLALVWAGRYHSLTVRKEANLAAAIESAGWASEEGSEALECVEVWDDEGHRVIPGREILARWYAAEAARAAAEPPPSDPCAKVVVLSPDGKEAAIDWFWNESESESEAEALRAILGPERVKLVRLV